MNWLKKHIYEIILVVTASILRFVNLGYSDYQGDEIKALFLPDPNQSIADFLLTQRKGPIQFLATYILKFADPGYDERFFMRFIFALAGVLAVYYFYKFAKLHFSKKVAFYAGFFVATNGFFIAFSRIVQYQSFVILFMVLTLYCFSLAVKKDGWDLRGLYLGFFFWALSVLSHYDGVFIFPFVAYLLFAWVRKEAIGIVTIKNIKHIAISGLIFLVLLLIFYIPFVLNIDEGTQSYWQGRLVGTGGKIASSKVLFSVYQPIYTLHIYTILFVLGVVGLATRVFTPKTVAELVAFRLRKIPGLVLLFFNDKFQKGIALTFWFLIPFIFLELIVEIPGTHIYTYLLPATIFLGFGIAFIENSVEWAATKVLRNEETGSRLAEIVTYAGVAVVFAFIFLQSYFVFVDHTYEYPWENEEFYVWEFHEPSPIFHLSMFGFPYYRGWNDVGDYVLTGTPHLPCKGLFSDPDCTAEVKNKVEFYSTNERKSISRYHISYPKDTDSAGYFILVRNPQSFSEELTSKKAQYWVEKYSPAKTIANVGGGSRVDGDVVAIEIYYMPAGTLEEIIALGY